MTDYISGPDTDKTGFLRKAGAILLEMPPGGLAPTGSYVCVLRSTELDVAVVIADHSTLRWCATDARPKQWLHVNAGLLGRLLYDGGSA